MIRLMLALAAALLTAGALLTACAPTSISGAGIRVGDSTQRVDGRDFRVHVPEHLPAHAPLVVMLHGGFGSARQAEQAYGWDALADREGVVVAYPDGQGRAWNAGGGCCGASSAHGTDDVGFVDAVVDRITSALSIDPDRVFATGMSNGAMMSYRLACDDDRFAAIAPVAGTLMGDCPSPHPVSVLAIAGLADTTVPFDGSPGTGRVKIDGPPVPEVIAGWRATDGCGAPSSTSSGAVTTETSDCSDGRAVELITVAGAGHQWPGADPDHVGGDTPSTALDATSTIWAFFAAHPRG